MLPATLVVDAFSRTQTSVICNFFDNWVIIGICLQYTEQGLSPLPTSNITFT